jgi:D-alanine-D-alanine ligase-like ATP-grasp enzyme
MSHTDAHTPGALIAKPHYPSITKALIELFNQGQLPQVLTIDIEPQYGHVGRIVYRSGAARLFRETNTGINSHGAAEIAKDKGYAKYFLQRLGYSTPRGKTFLFPEYAAGLAKNLARFGFDDYQHVAQIVGYVEREIGYPCFIKPNDGSQGRDIYKCADERDVAFAIEHYRERRIDLALVEEAITFPDYRVVVLDDRMIAAYLRKPLTVIGDGQATIGALLAGRQQELSARGKRTLIDADDPRIRRSLERAGRSLKTVPGPGELIQIHHVSNLSTGGEAEDVSERICERWRDLCVRITAEMGLRFCGVDIACPDLSDPDAPYSIIEINASPGVSNYAAIGERQAAVARELYRTIFDQPPRD